MWRKNSEDILKFFLGELVVYDNTVKYTYAIKIRRHLVSL